MKITPYAIFPLHYNDVIMGTIASQISSLTIVYSTAYSGADQRKHQLRVTGLCAGNLPGPVNSPHQWPVTRKIFPFDDVIMIIFTFHTIHSPNKKMLPLENVISNAVLSRKLKRLFHLYNLQQKNISFRKWETYSNIVILWKYLISYVNILWDNPAP